MIKGLATIVLPIYNVEKYLDRCINSVVNQTYRDLEIILVDDGSPDNCPRMCEEWVKMDARIKVIHKENAGLGMARNTGIENASGEYIFFFDSDDYVALNLVESVMSTAKQVNADMIVFGHYSVNTNGDRKTFIPNTEKRYYQGREVQDIILPEMVAADPGARKSNLGMSACMSAFSSELIRRSGIRFVSEREYISEDVYFLLCLMKDVNSIAVIPEGFYFYCENGASLTHVYRSDRYLQAKKFYNACIQKCDELGYGQVVKDRFAYLYMSYVIAAMKLIVRSDLTKKVKRENINKIIHDGLMRQLIQKIDIRKEPLKRRILLATFRHKLSIAAYYLVLAGNK